MLTARGGTQHVVGALESGADDFITKPFDREELQARIHVGRRIVGLQTSQSVVFAFARAAEAKSPYTQGHAERVTDYVLEMAVHLGLSGQDRDQLRRGGLLHDIGKICIPDAILDKPGKLTQDELEVIHRHPVHGVQIIEPLQSLHDVIPLIRWHHERLDGRGYPDGLSGDAIPMMVRMLSVADVYDALASDRPYRKALSHAESLQILRDNARDGGLDAELVECFSEVMRGRATIRQHRPHRFGSDLAQRHIREELLTFA
jgi:putative two-component system response regulator